jgi:hypothetical protein
LRTSTFAAAFPGGSYPGSASESTVSRWETGAGRATFHTVRRYEELLGLPSGTLVAPVDYLHRYTAPTGRSAPGLTRAVSGDRSAVPYRRIEELLDRVGQADPMTGADWDELTGHLAVRPDLVLVPSRLWTDLAERLLAEMMVADGLGWMQRSEALHRLMAHPVGQAAAVAVCAGAIANPGNNVFIEPMAILDASLHPDANRLVLAELIQPTNVRTRYGALLACVRKVRDGHFNSDQLVAVRSTIDEIVTGGDAHVSTVALAVDVLRRMPPPVRAGASRRLHQLLAADRTLSEVMSAGRLATSASSGVVVNRVVQATIADGLREPPGFTDELLPTLIDEMLFSPVLDTSLLASLLVRSSPYASRFGAALASELATPRVVGDTALACAMLGTLRSVSCLAHVGGRSTDEFWGEALSRHGRVWSQHRTRLAADSLTTLVYGMGVARNFGMLTRVRADDTAPRPAREAAAWWLAQPANHLVNA